MRDLVIVGTGGVGRTLRVFLEDLNRMEPHWHLLGYVDDNPPVGHVIGDHAVLGSIDWLQQQKELDVLVAMGTPHVRRAVAERLRASSGLRFPSLVHPGAYVPSSVFLGLGTIIYPGACIDPATRLGNFVLVNKNATIGHDTVIHDFATVSPGACIGGAVTVGPGADIGIGATCNQGLTLGAGCRVGAGAAVVKDVASGQTVVGVPARPMDSEKRV